MAGLATSRGVGVTVDFVYGEGAEICAPEVAVCPSGVGNAPALALVPSVNHF